MTINWYTDLTLAQLQEKYPFAEVTEVTSQGDIEILQPKPKAPAAHGQNNTLVRRKVSLDVQPDDSSYRYRALMTKPTVMLKFSLPEFVEIPVGAWIEFLGQNYYLRCPEDIKKQGSRNIEYTLNMYDRSSELGDYKLRNTVDRRLKFSMCAKPREFLQLIVDNLNERDGNVWEVGTYIDSNEKTVEFNHVFIDAGLQAVADEFKTEWQITPSETAGKFKVSLGKVELPMPPYRLAYGRGNGFVPGVGRTSKSDEKPVKRLYVQGGEQNIDRSKNLPYLYRGTAAEGDTTSAALLLPIGQSIRYDGKHFEGEDEFDSNSAREYTVDEDGYSIIRTDEKSTAVKEDSLDLSEIYPKRVGHVTGVRLGSEVSEEYARKEHFYDIVDSSPDIPNYRDYIIKGETMTIIFQSGMLAGREFEVDYIHDAKGETPGHRFKISPAEIDGITMPDPETGFFPQSGDEYAVFGVMLPDSYICDNATKTGAAWDMFREAVKYLYEHEDQKFTFTGELQGLWAKRNWGQVGSYMEVGAYILFTDDQFATEGVKIRVVGVKEFLNNPYAPTLEISNDVGASSTVSTQLREADNAEVVIGETKSELQQFTKRRFRDAKETLAAFAEAFSENFSAGINPVTIETMAALIGDESLQFEFGTATGDSFAPYVPNIAWNSVTKRVTVPGCWLRHLTLGQNSITTQERRDTVEGGNHPIWFMPHWQSGVVSSEDERLYLYAVCPVNGSSGSYLLTKNSQKFKQNDKYNFLVGILSSEYEGERSFVKVYGFTEILPGRITTDRIVSTDGENIINLQEGSVQFGDCLLYNLDGDKTLHLKFLASENSNLGGWIFRDNLLISQKGTVEGDEAEYNDIEPNGRFPGGLFIPNISMDAVNGKIMQGDNLVIDDDGISLLNERGKVAAHITNNSIGEIGDLANASDTKSVHFNKTQSQSLPYGGNTYRQTLLIGVVDVGFLSAGSTITHNNSHVDFNVPSPNDGQAGNNQIRCVFAQMNVELYRGNTKVATLAFAVMTSSHSAGQTVDLSNGTTRVVTVGANNIPEGNYTIRLSVTYDLLGDNSATLTNINTSGNIGYSFSKYGFQRTVLGNDGFYTSWAQNQYIFANAEGITLRHGDAVIKLSGDGLQKSIDGGDTFSNI